MFGTLTFKNGRRKASSFTDRTYSFQQDLPTGQALACDACRTLKVKCNRDKRGCDRCNSNGLSCHYTSSKKTAKARTAKHSVQGAAASASSKTAVGQSNVNGSKTDSDLGPAREHGALECPAMMDQAEEPADTPGAVDDDFFVVDPGSPPLAWLNLDGAASTVEDATDPLNLESMNFLHQTFPSSHDDGVLTPVHSLQPRTHAIDSYLLQNTPMALSSGPSGSARPSNQDSGLGSTASPTASPTELTQPQSAINAPQDVTGRRRLQMPPPPSLFYRPTTASTQMRSLSLLGGLDPELASTQQANDSHACTCLSILTSNLEDIDAWLETVESSTLEPAAPAGPDDLALELHKTAVQDCHRVLACHQACSARPEFARLLTMILERLTTMCTCLASACYRHDHAMRALQPLELDAAGARSGSASESGAHVQFGRYTISTQAELRSLARVFVAARYRALAELAVGVKRCVVAQKQVGGRTTTHRDGLGADGPAKGDAGSASGQRVQQRLAVVLRSLELLGRHLSEQSELQPRQWAPAMAS